MSSVWKARNMQYANTNDSKEVVLEIANLAMSSRG
jgi:hypothetical protein